MLWLMLGLRLLMVMWAAAAEVHGYDAEQDAQAGDVEVEIDDVVPSDVPERLKEKAKDTAYVGAVGIKLDEMEPGFVVEVEIGDAAAERDDSYETGERKADARLYAGCWSEAYKTAVAVADTRMYEAWMMVEQQLDSFGDKDWEVASVVEDGSWPADNGGVCCCSQIIIQRTTRRWRKWNRILMLALSCMEADVGGSTDISPHEARTQKNLMRLGGDVKVHRERQQVVACKLQEMEHRSKERFQPNRIRKHEHLPPLSDYHHKALPGDLSDGLYPYVPDQILGHHDDWSTNLPSPGTCRPLTLPHHPHLSHPYDEVSIQNSEHTGELLSTPIVFPEKTGSSLNGAIYEALSERRRLANLRFDIDTERSGTIMTIAPIHFSEEANLQEDKGCTFEDNRMRKHRTP
ncbi:hypothetical protein F5051DRAFT_505528 [Lentinula edodes]|nr:hypothetical protein F5051DRAFT_505528 [Lentinula edodes]